MQALSDCKIMQQINQKSIPACPLIHAACNGDHLSTVSVLIRSGKALSNISQTSRLPLYAAENEEEIEYDINKIFMPYDVQKRVVL